MTTDAEFISEFQALHSKAKAAVDLQKYRDAEWFLLVAIENVPRLIGMVEKAEAERDAALAKVVRLRAVVDAAAFLDDIPGEGEEDLPDDEPVSIRVGTRTIYYSMTLGEFRALQSALHASLSSKD